VSGAGGADPDAHASASIGKRARTASTSSGGALFLEVVEEATVQQDLTFLGREVVDQLQLGHVEQLGRVAVLARVAISPCSIDTDQRNLEC
jgi:hypothetical protein